MTASNNTSGYTGISPHKDGGFVAKYHEKYCGWYSDIDEARKAREKEKQAVKRQKLAQREASKMQPNFHQYHITNKGKIYLNDEPHPTREDPRGNIVAYLRIDGKPKTIRVAKEQCLIYKDVPENHKAVVFKDNDKSNLDLDNMITMTTSDAGKYRLPPKPKKVNGGYPKRPVFEPSIAATISWK